MTFEIKARGILLTWNVPENSDFGDFREWIIRKTLDNGDSVSICHERGSHEHFHAYIHRDKQIDCSIKNYEYINVTPNCQPNKVTGSGFMNAVKRGHFYVSCIYKNTYITGWSNFPPNVAYVVKSQWIVDMIATDKIDIDQAEECLAYYVCLTPQLQAMYTLTRNKLKTIKKREYRAERARILESRKRPFKEIDGIAEWKVQYNQVEDRYHFLVLFGPSRTGKTQLAKSLFSNPFVHKDSICWTGYNEDEHDAIIFDDVKYIFKHISEQKSLFQAGGIVTVQTSATNMYALDIDVAGKPIIVTTNTDPEGEWIMANSFAIGIFEECFHPPEVEPQH